MLVVETVRRIRREHADGKAIKAIARDLRLSRKVVRKAIRSPEVAFNYQRTVQPLPRIGPYQERLDALLSGVSLAVPAEVFAVADTNWVAQVEATLKPIAAGPFLIHGPHDRTAAAAHPLAIEIEAGGALNGNLQSESPQVREQLTILFRTPETASHALAAHPRVPEPVRRAVSRAFLSMANDEAGRALLRAIDTPDPVPADFARDYQPLERLGLEKYLVIDKD